MNYSAVQRVEHPRTKSKVRVSPKDWRTVFDLMSAKIKHFSCFPKNIMEKFDLYVRIYFVGKPPPKDFL